MDFQFIKPLLKEDAKGKIVMLVMDGLGGLPLNPDGKTELETALTPNMDALAAKSCLGLHHSVPYGITPGSGQAHLGLFGYDPVKYEIGRGVLSALGVDFDLGPNDVAARGNRFAGIADAARADCRAAGAVGAGAVQGFGDNARRRGLADAADAGQQPGLRDLLAGDGVAERAHHRVLAEQAVEVRRAVLARQHAIRGRRGDFGNFVGGKQRIIHSDSDTPSH